MDAVAVQVGAHWGGKAQAGRQAGRQYWWVCTCIHALRRSWPPIALAPLTHCPLPSTLYSYHLLRMDAAGHIQPDFWPWFVGQTELVAWLETGGEMNLTAQYEQGEQAVCRPGCQFGSSRS